MAGTAAGGTGGATPMGTGMCCADGNCLCHGEPPTRLDASKGPFDTRNYTIPQGPVSYPTDAEPPFAAVAITPGFLNDGPEMASWGPFLASYAIVTIVVRVGSGDLPDVRATKLLAAIEALRAENTKEGSVLFGKLSDRFGISGYSFGGGGATIGAGRMPLLKSDVGLATFTGNGNRVMVPTLLLCGSADSTAPCSMTDGVYAAIPETTPKMKVVIAGANHFSWFDPGDGERGRSGGLALAFHKVFLEGDERWKPLLLGAGERITTNIK